MATQNNKNKKLPKVKERSSVGDLLIASNNKLRQMAVSKKIVVETYKKVKWAAANPRKAYKEIRENTSKAIKGTAAATIVSEVPVLGLLFGREKKKKEQEKKKKTTDKSILDTILKEVKIIKAVMKKGSAAKGGYSTTPSTAKQEDDVENEPVDAKQEEPTKLGTAAKVGLLAVGGLAVLHLFRSGKDYKPNQPIPPQPEGPPRPEPQSGNMGQQAQGIQVSNPEQQFDELLKKFDGFPDTIEGMTKKIEAARKDFEKQTGVKIGEQIQQPSQQEAATPPATAPNPYEQDINKQAEDLAAAYQPAPRPTPVSSQPAETPGAVKTGTGGVLVTTEGEAVTAPATVPVPVARPPAAPRPTPAPLPSPTPQPARPAPAPAPTPAPTVSNRPALETEKKPEGITSSGKFLSEKEFVSGLKPWAEYVSKIIGGKVPPFAILGQWAGESGAGKSLPADFNYAGIKAGKKFQKGDFVLTEERYTDQQLAAAEKSGESLERVLGKDDKLNKKGRLVTVDEWYGKGTWQKTKDEGKNWVQVRSYFAKFKDLKDFSDSFAGFIMSPRYSKAREQTTAAGFGFEIAKAGYATASAEKYSAKVADFDSKYSGSLNTSTNVPSTPSSGTQLAEASTAVQSQRPRSATNTRVMIIKDTQRVSLPAQ